MCIFVGMNFHSLQFTENQLLLLCFIPMKLYSYAYNITWQHCTGSWDITMVSRYTNNSFVYANQIYHLKIYQANCGPNRWFVQTAHHVSMIFVAVAQKIKILYPQLWYHMQSHAFNIKRRFMGPARNIQVNTDNIIWMCIKTNTVHPKNCAHRDCALPTLGTGQNWEAWRLESSATQLFDQQLIRLATKKASKLRICELYELGPLRGNARATVSMHGLAASNISIAYSRGTIYAANSWQRLPHFTNNVVPSAKWRRQNSRARVN